MLHNLGSVLSSCLSCCRNANDHRNTACMADNNSLRTIYPIAHTEDLDHWEMSSCGYPCGCASRVSHSWRLTKAFLGFSNSKENWNIIPTPPPSSCQEPFWHDLFFFFGVWLCLRSWNGLPKTCAGAQRRHHFLWWVWHHLCLPPVTCCRRIDKVALLSCKTWVQRMEPFSMDRSLLPESLWQRWWYWNRNCYDLNGFELWSVTPKVSEEHAAASKCRWMQTVSCSLEHGRTPSTSRAF